MTTPLPPPRPPKPNFFETRWGMSKEEARDLLGEDEDSIARAPDDSDDPDIREEDTP